MRKQNASFVRAGDLLQDAVPVYTDPAKADLPEPLQKSLQSTMELRRQGKVIQLPLWYEEERGTPNSFLRSALFAAIQGKDRKLLKGATLASSKDVTVKYTGEQLNQEDLSIWETLVHIARQHPLGNVCQFTAYALSKSSACIREAPNTAAFTPR